jgi:hypothetical protein
MRNTAIRLTLVLLAMVLFGACQKPPAAPDTTSLPPTSQTPGDEPESVKSDVILPMHARKKGPIIVGGCKESCEDPKNAFRNFTRALFGVSNEDLPEWRTFVDSTTLIDNGNQLGTHWADMWIMKRFDERAAEVDGWLAAYRLRVGHVADPQAVEDSLASGLQFRRISSTEVEFIFVAPDRESANNSGEWRLRMGRRGLEWLVQAIYD